VTPTAPRGTGSGIGPPEVFGPPASGASPSARTALAPLYVLDVLTAFTVGMLPPLLPLVTADWGLSTVEAGLINTIYAIGRLAGSYPASRIRARWGTRSAVFLGVFGLVAGSLGCGVAPAFPLFLVGRLVMGLGSSIAFLAVFAQLLEAAPGPSRGRLATAFEAMAILSLGVGGVLAATIAQRAGWRPVFAGAAGVLLLCGLTWPALGPHAGRRPPDPEVGPGRWVPGKEVRALAPIYAACLAMSLTWSGLFATLAPLLGHDRYGLGSQPIGWALAAGYMAELIGLSLVAVVIDRVPREPLFLGGAVAVALGGLVLALGLRPATFVLGLVLVGGGFAVWMVPPMLLSDRAGTPLPPAPLAVYRISLDGGMILGPILLGGLAQLAGQRVVVGGGGLILIAGALVLARRGRGV
jgi:MFS family permease